MFLNEYAIAKGHSGALERDGVWLFADTLTPIDISDVCRHENGPGFVAVQETPGNPYTWKCVAAGGRQDNSTPATAGGIFDDQPYTATPPPPTPLYSSPTGTVSHTPPPSGGQSTAGGGQQQGGGFLSFLPDNIERAIAPAAGQSSYVPGVSNMVLIAAGVGLLWMFGGGKRR